ncbi:unnamed protein product [Trifolium pratense]|uniref:Uncharacterized protein n=1 Tax=Trifolium pratense TaxID=57577 RepID=A0ACB0LLB2_TRIPR|nr:unnamed protein product [Trifolium pratense]
MILYFYIQKRKNMAEILKFVYAMILFLSLFIDAAKYIYRKPSFFSRLHECEQDGDCPEIVSYPLVLRCIGYNCVVVNSQE